MVVLSLAFDANFIHNSYRNFAYVR